MTSTSHTVTVPGPAGSRMALDLPAGWSETPVPDPVLAAFSDGRALSPAIDTNAVLTAVELPAGTQLRGWQTLVRDTQLGTLPDLQVLDDREVEGPDGTAQWYTSTVMTDAHGATVLTRRWSRLLPGVGLTLTLTTLPLVDAEHAEVLDAIADSWTTTADTAPEESPDDHA